MTFSFYWGRAVPSPSFQLLGAGDRAAADLRNYNGSLPCLHFLVCLGSRLRAGPFLSLFPGNILYKDWRRLHSACPMLAFTVPAPPALVLGAPSPSQVSLLCTGKRREML